MQKKSFKNNPALQFISEPDNNLEEREKENIIDTKKQPDKFEIQEEKIRSIVNEQGQTVPVKLNPLYVETKSKRMQLLMQPTLHGELKTIAMGKGVSVNDLIHKVLEGYIKSIGKS